MAIVAVSSDRRWQAQDNVRLFGVPFAIISTRMGIRCERLRKNQTPIGKHAVGYLDCFEVWYPEGNWMEEKHEEV